MNKPPLRDAQRHRLNRLGDNLTRIEQQLQKNPLASEKGTILQSGLYFTSLETKWAQSGPLARFLINLDAALIGAKTEESAGGIIGPSLDKIFEGSAQLMKAVLGTDATPGAAEFLSGLLKLTSLGLLYLSTEVLGHWETLFPQEDQAAATKGGMLFRELSLSYLLGMGALETLFKSFAAEAGVDETGQKKVVDIAMLQLILFLITMIKVENRRGEELLETLYPFILPTLNSVEEGIRKAETQGWLPSDMESIALSRIQLLRRALEMEDLEALPQAIEGSFEALRMSYKEFKDDIKRVILLSSQWNRDLNYISTQAQVSIANMTQAA